MNANNTNVVTADRITFARRAGTVLANQMFYIVHCHRPTARYEVRAASHGGLMVTGKTSREAHRKAIRMGIARLRLGKILPGIAKQNIEWLWHHAKHIQCGIDLNGTARVLRIGPLKALDLN